ncbi:Tm-1-like ATP-binding domain-containing protein [Maribacter sp. HTCC2170]|uniref:Tm-1-like ATP-binding domain-containing protein n=1 Tax=Maribacter sp. (strain HTCC2170 / KCCM 42371) TaxID=313603 RepID=UPI00006B1B06|nr:Tm-1-like ATP-binding domain-containing protein [Maribacter sp. HTCC2170]EAR00779.1 hypothetical protein FB2170_16881 [Maribacter sp. HTCC2170]
MPSTKTVLIIGCFDTKGEDFDFLYNCLLEQNIEVISINTGVLGTTKLFPVTIDSVTIAEAAGTSLFNLIEDGDRGRALEKMGEGASIIISELMTKKKIDGFIGMGGGGGTYVFLSAVNKIPFGIPKLCLTTLATKDLSEHIGSKDITLIPSIVDVAGLNKISRILINQAAGALVGMMNVIDKSQSQTRGSIAISIFGNTTPCVDRCSKILRKKEFDVLSFHAVGAGGKTMEDLVLDDCFDAVLDITTTELADDLCGGICSAGPERLTAAGKMGIPQVVVPGCLDMVNFGALKTVPRHYQQRQLFSWDPNVTLMRTNKAENKILGTSFAQKLNDSQGKVVVLLPMKGISKISREGEVFYAPDVDNVLFDSIKQNLSPEIPIIEVDTDINHAKFADIAVMELLKLIQD